MENINPGQGVDAVDLILLEIKDRGIFCGETRILKYNREEAEIAVLSFVGFGSQKIFLLTPDGAFWGKHSGNDIVRISGDGKIDSPDDLEKCEQVREAVRRHAPGMAEKMPQYYTAKPS